MAVWMQPIKLNYSKGFHEPHGVDEIRGTRCHGCRAMSCIPQRNRHAPWRYYCNELRRSVEPSKLKDGDCPVGNGPRGKQGRVRSR